MTQPLVVRIRRELTKRKVVCVVPAKALDNNAFNSTYTLQAYHVLADDDLRMRAYENGIRKLVPGKKVIDLGTGALAHLAKICRAAGAAKVYAVEQNAQFRESIEASIRAGEGTAPIEAIYGFSTDVDLPEKCDVLVQQVIGTIASNEGVARTVRDAKARFLKPGADCLPREVATYVCPVSPLELAPSHRVVNRLLGGASAIEPRRMYEVLHFPIANRMAAPAEFERYVFADDFALTFERRLEFQMSRSGAMDGLVFFIEIVVDERNVIANDSHELAWPNPYIRLFDEPVAVAAGDRLVLDVRVDVSTILPKYSIDAHLFTSQGERRASFAWAGAGK